jgi:hypothetical protein
LTSLYRSGKFTCNIYLYNSSTEKTKENSKLSKDQKLMNNT